MTEIKPRVRVKAPTLHLGSGVPHDARPGDLVVGNRGAAARVYRHKGQFASSYLLLEYAGNFNHDYGVKPDLGCKVYDFR